MFSVFEGIISIQKPGQGHGKWKCDQFSPNRGGVRELSERPNSCILQQKPPVTTAANEIIFLILIRLFVSMKTKLSIAVPIHGKSQNIQGFYDSESGVLDGVPNLGLREIVAVVNNKKMIL